MIWIWEITWTSERTIFLEVTRESYLYPWPWSVIHHWSSLMNLLLVLIPKPRDLCGILSPRSLPRKKRVASSSLPILWKKLRLFVPKWASWLKATSSVSVPQPTSRTSLVLDMRWNSRSEVSLRRNLTRWFRLPLKLGSLYPLWSKIVDTTCKITATVTLQTSLTSMELDQNSLNLNKKASH